MIYLVYPARHPEIHQRVLTEKALMEGSNQNLTREKVKLTQRQKTQQNIKISKRQTNLL